MIFTLILQTQDTFNTTVWYLYTTRVDWILIYDSVVGYLYTTMSTHATYIIQPADTEIILVNIAYFYQDYQGFYIITRDEIAYLYSLPRLLYYYRHTTTSYSYLVTTLITLPTTISWYSYYVRYSYYLYALGYFYYFRHSGYKLNFIYLYT